MYSLRWLQVNLYSSNLEGPMENAQRKDARLWFASYGELYYGSEPYFYEAEDNLVVNYLKANNQSLIKQLESLWERNESGNLKHYADDGLQYPPQSWSKLVFKVWGIENRHTLDRFPEVNEMLRKFPEISSCFVSKTKAHSKINLHSGETNGIIRLHLGLRIPNCEVDQCGIRVGSMVRSWNEGKVLAFLDAHPHEVWNKTDFDRYILIIDLIRPEFKRKWQLICVRIITNQIFFNFCDVINVGFFYNAPKLFLFFMSLLLYLPLLSLFIISKRKSFFKI